MGIGERWKLRALRRRRGDFLGLAERARRQRAADEAFEMLGNVDAAAAGASDGEIELPANQEPVEPPLLRKIANYTNAVVADIGKEWIEEDEILYAHQKSLEAKLGATWSSGVEGAIASQDDMRAAAPTLPPWTFWVFVVAIIAADFPLTLSVFETLSPGRGGIVDYLLAIGVQAVLFAAAKAAGVLVYKSGFAKPTSGVARTGVIVLALLVVVASISLAVFRTNVVSNQLSQTTLDDIGSLFQPPTDAGTDDPPAGDAPSIDLPEPEEPSRIPSLVTFGALLILTFAVATVLGWLTHAPHAQALARKLAAVRAGRRRRFEAAEAEAETAEHHARTLGATYWAANEGARREPMSTLLQRLAETSVTLADHPWRMNPEKYDF